MKAVVNSEYSKIQQGDATTFTVAPAVLAKWKGWIVAGVIIVLLGLTADPGTTFGALLLGGGLIYVGVVDKRPKAHKVPSTFTVTPKSIASNGHTFNKSDIHRLSVGNAMIKDYENTPDVKLRQASHAYVLQVESGGKSYDLAGGMDQVTARGLQGDVGQVLEFVDLVVGSR